MFDNGYAIIIGVGGDLAITKKDALAIADLLMSPKCGYSKNHVYLLTESEASKSTIFETLDAIRNVTGTDPDTTLFFYFSGHGKQLRQEHQSPSYYLLPWGYNIENLTETAISGEELSKWLKLMAYVRKMCLIFDCCHAGGIADFKAAGDSLISSYPLPFDPKKELGSGTGRVVVASSRADEVSNLGTKYSVFTETFLEVFSSNKSRSEDGFIRVLDLFTYLSRAVPAKTSGSQNPILYAVNLQDNFALAHSDAETVGQESNLIAEEHIALWERMLQNYKESLLLIEQRMSEYVMSIDIPLQYKREKELKLQAIFELESKLRRV
jgi:hypothetical protein